MQHQSGFPNLENPIPNHCNDDKELKEIIKGLKLIPKRGNTENSQHSYLNLLYDLFELSTTDRSCVIDKSDYAFGSRFDVIGMSDSFLVADDTDLNVIAHSSKVEYSRYHNDVWSFRDMLKTVKQLYLNEAICGDPYLRLRLVTVGSEKKVSVSVLDPRHVMKIAKENPNDPERLVLAKRFNKKDFKDGKYEVLPVYPNWKGKETSSIRETVFHWNDSMFAYDDQTDSLYWKYVEFSLSDLACKVSGSAMVTRNIFAMKQPALGEDDGGDTDYELEARKATAKLSRLLTNIGPNSKEISTVFYEDEKPEIYKININRNEGWTEKMQDIARSQIIGSRRWSSLILGMEKPSSGIGGNVLLDDLQLRKTVIVRIQERYQNRLSEVLDHIYDFMGTGEQFRNLRPVFVDAIGNTIDNINTLKNGEFSEPATIVDDTGS